MENPPVSGKKQISRRGYAAYSRGREFAARPRGEQRSIALYGLVSEIGSVVAAVKKKILAEGGEDARWDQPNDEIKEELGDALWYCYSTARIINNGYYDILAAHIAVLRAEIGSGDERAQKIATSLDPAKRAFAPVPCWHEKAPATALSEGGG